MAGGVSRAALVPGRATPAQNTRSVTEDVAKHTGDDDGYLFSDPSESSR